MTDYLTASNKSIQIDRSAGSSLKAKLLLLQETIIQMNDQVNLYKDEIKNLQAGKDALEVALTEKLTSTRKEVTSEMGKVEEVMKKQFAQQKAEHTRLQQQINTLKAEKTAIQQELLALQKRICELENQVGS